ncbi:hypothetical protein G5B38_17070 [Pseudohalocynthiibacter aestuariivivens]|nr:hypothetical protein [Pseudohalocynthiibacter aestuariivivens]QIE47098.1 hypothetical protein G5B38_17070 [Pseudohalocynthiibacter aestuariivivens]
MNITIEEYRGNVSSGRQEYVISIRRFKSAAGDHTLRNSYFSAKIHPLVDGSQYLDREAETLHGIFVSLAHLLKVDLSEISKNVRLVWSDPTNL